MIASLTGIIREKAPPHLLIEVNGVGYELQAPMTTFYQLPEPNKIITLFTHLAIREDAHQLFGFIHKRDRDLFRILIKINGVGPKLALSILSGIEPDNFVHAIHAQDLSHLVKIPGIGKKTAERLLIECRDALKKYQPTTPSSSLEFNAAYEDALQALHSLGYKPLDAKKAIDKIYKAGCQTEELIREALSQMVKGTHS